MGYNSVADRRPLLAPRSAKSREIPREFELMNSNDKDIQGHRSWCHSKAHGTSYYSLIVTLDVSPIVFEILTFKTRKWLVFPPYLTLPLGEYAKISGWNLRRWKFHNPNFNRFWHIHPCDGRTERRALAYSALSIWCRALKRRCRNHRHICSQNLRTCTILLFHPKPQTVCSEALVVTVRNLTTPLRQYWRVFPSYRLCVFFSWPDQHMPISRSASIFYHLQVTVQSASNNDTTLSLSPRDTVTSTRQ